jgi:phage-related protein
MKWTVETLNKTVEAEIKALPADMIARFVRISLLISTQGLEHIGEPHVKHLESKLWEIRIKGKDGIARAIYVTAKGKRVVVVRAFVKKTQKTPRSELALARERAKEVR